MEQSLSRARTRTISNARDPFQDSAFDKSLPSLPPPDPDQLNTNDPKPGTPPLPPYLQFGHGNVRASLIRMDKPSVKEIARTFERENSTELNSRNPYRDHDSPTKPGATIFEPDPRAGFARQSSMTFGTGDMSQHQRAATEASVNNEERVMSRLSVCSADYFAGPGPDIGPGYGGYSQGAPQHGHTSMMSATSADTCAGPGPDIGPYAYHQATSSSGQDVYDYGSNIRNQSELGTPDPSEEEAVDNGPISDEEYIRPHRPFSPSAQRRQGLVDGAQEALLDILAPTQASQSGRSGSTKVGTEQNEDRRSVLTLVSPLEARKRRQQKQQNVSTDATIEEKIPFTQLLKEENLHKRGETFGSVESNQNPPPVAATIAPPIPARSGERKPLFRQKLNLPVRPRSVDRNDDGNPLAMSYNVNVAAAPVYMTAKKADFKLEAERQKMGTPSLRPSHVQPSPIVLRVAAEIARNNGIILHTGSRAVLRSVPFWILVVVLQCSMLSTTAAIAVVLRDHSASEGATINSSSLFWLVISIVLFAISGSAVLFVWAKKMGYFSTFNKKLGMDEVGLLDRALRQAETGRTSIEQANTGTDVEANAAGAYQRRPRTFETSATQASMTSTQAPSPEWDSMYAKPQSHLGHAANQQTPCRPSTSRGENVMNNGFSPAGFNEPSPISPMEPVHLQHASRYPFNSPCATDEHLLPSPSYHFKNKSAPLQSRQSLIQAKDNKTAKAGIHAAGWSPLDHFTNDLAIAHNAPEHQRQSIIAVKNAESKERSKMLRNSVESPSNMARLKRAAAFDSIDGVSFQTMIAEEDEGRTGKAAMSASGRLMLQRELEIIGKEGGQLIRSPDMLHLAARAKSRGNQLDSGFDNSGFEMDDLTGKTASSTYGSAHAKQESAGNASNNRSMFAVMKDHFTEQHGRSLGSAMKEKRTKKVDDQVRF